jgi:hypothetical protein
VVALKESVPLRRVACHVERSQEQLASISSFLNAEELLAAIQPRQRIFSAVEGWKEQFVAVARGVGDGIPGGGGAGLLGGQQFLRLQPIDGHGELPLVALHCSKRGGDLVDHRAQLCQLVIRHRNRRLGLGR